MSAGDAEYKILLFQQDPIDRAVAAGILVEAGYCVDEAENGPHAVAQASARRYSLILIDSNSPGSDGFDCARQIRRLHHPFGGAPMLAFAEAPRQEERRLCETVLIDGLLNKPIAPDRFLEMVARWAELGEDATWGLVSRPGIDPPLLNRCALEQLEEDIGAEAMPEILPTLLVEIDRRVQLLAESASAGDAAGAASEAHTLKGSAGTFGAMALRQAAFDMEQAGRAGDGVRVGQLLPLTERLARETCDRLRVAFPFLA